MARLESGVGRISDGGHAGRVELIGIPTVGTSEGGIGRNSDQRCARRKAELVGIPTVGALEVGIGRNSDEVQGSRGPGVRGQGVKGK